MLAYTYHVGCSLWQGHDSDWDALMLSAASMLISTTALCRLSVHTSVAYSLKLCPVRTMRMTPHTAHMAASMVCSAKSLSMVVSSR